MLVCAGKNENISYATPIGVGLVDSAIGLSRICMRECVESLVFVGSAGAYAYDMPLFSICISTRATQIESSFISGASYTPMDNCVGLENVSQETLEQIGLRNLHSHQAYLHNIIVNSSNYITTDFTHAEQMSRAGIAVENMEFFSVLRVAQEFAIPALGVFCVTNYCDTNAHKDFLAHHQQAKMSLENFIQTHLQSNSQTHL